MKESQLTSHPNPDLGSNLRCPTPTFLHGIPRLAERLALNPRNHGADEGGNVNGDNTEPDKGPGPALGETQQCDSERRLSPTKRSQREGCAGADDLNVCGEVGDPKVPAVVAQPILDNKGSSEAVCDDYGDLAEV